MNHFLYCRKSMESDERQVLSIEAQKREMSEIALKYSLTILNTFEESKSGRIPHKRPLFREMLYRINKGEAEGILCWQINRLSRNWQEAGELLQMLTEGKIKEIRTIDKVYTDVDSNDIMMGVEFGASSQYSKEISKNVKRGYRQKIEKGQYPSYAPTFYINAGSRKGDKNIAPDPQKAEHFEPWIDYIIKNECTLEEAAEWLNKRGVTTRNDCKFRKGTVDNILKNPVYCGILRWGEEIPKEGNWEPLISPDKFRRLQKVLGNKSKPSRYSHIKGYKGLMLCAHCGCSITCTHKIKNGKSYIYYHCTKRRGACNQPYLTEQELEDQIFEQITKIQIDKDVLDLCHDLIKEKHQEEYKDFQKKKAAYHQKELETDKMLDELLDMRIKKQITQDVYESKKRELLKDKESFQNFTQDNEFNHGQWIENLETFFETCYRIEDIFNRGTIDERSKLVKALGKNLTLENGVLGWNFRKPWNSMLLAQNEATRTNWLLG